MKKLKLLVVMVMFGTTFSNAQQWITESYDYDSIIDLEYGQAENFLGAVVPLKMDIYLPICESSTGTSKTPLAIFIHGGSFLAGDKSETTITNLAKSFAKRGYATASVNYRLGFVNEFELNQCNFPNYPCFFASDTAEWYRAYFRAVQDVKGAMRYLVNRNVEYQIDPQNIFVAGESAGAFIAMGVAYMDVPSEKFDQANELDGVLTPNFNTITCPHNQNQVFPNATILRPDLGTIDGAIEPTSIPYMIKGVGNFFGGMLSNLLDEYDVSKPKAALYQFHQPCDLIVPFESDGVYAYQNWCFTNGYNCYAIGNTALVHGSKTISDWNVDNSYGYAIQNNFTSIDFPFEYIGLQPRNCYDQVINGNGCHAYDNFTNRKNQLISFFAPLVSTSPICTPGLLGSEGLNNFQAQFSIYPNPFSNQFIIESKIAATYSVTDVFGRKVNNGSIAVGKNLISMDNNLCDGVYFVSISSEGSNYTFKLIKENK